jgi:hypothetical protein
LRHEAFDHPFDHPATPSITPPIGHSITSAIMFDHPFDRGVWDPPIPPCQIEALARGSGHRSCCSPSITAALALRSRSNALTEDTMTDNESKELTTKPTDDTGKSLPKRVTGKLKAVCDLMVWEGMPWNDAAQKMNFRTRSMRLAMERPHVLKYLTAQRRVLLAQSSGQNLHRLGKLRDQDSNPAAAVQAARALEALAVEAQGGASASGASSGRAGWVIDLGSEPTAPGLVIHVHHPAPAPDAGLMIDVTPNPVGKD